MSVRIAAAGGTIAAVGGIAILRPMVRTGGPFNHAVVETFGGLVKEGALEDADLKRRLERLEDKDELAVDRMLERVIGPAFVALGTLINGYSGFFS